MRMSVELDVEECDLKAVARELAVRVSMASTGMLSLSATDRLAIRILQGLSAETRATLVGAPS